MDDWQLYVFACLSGIVVAGLTASLCELLYDRPASFRQLAGNGSRRRFIWAFVVTAGPFMLLNDVMDARRGGRIGAISLIAAVATALMWASASGIVIVDLGWRFSRIAL